MKEIVIIGSLNMDSVIETSHMPEKGETVSGKELLHVPGGKGANQAYAIGKLGGKGVMIGAVGDDEFGRILKKNLEDVNVDTKAISTKEGVPTGQAFITVDNQGENSIIIMPGANQYVTKEMIDKNNEIIRQSNIIIMQFEIPIETVEYIKQKALDMGKTIIVDPAPARPDIPDDFWNGIDYIKPNETELGILCGKKISTKEDLREGAKFLLDKGVKHVLVTLGKSGCYFATKDKEEFFKAYEVETVDSTAAGDSFTAAFALALSEGEDDYTAIQFAQTVSSIVVTKKGAQTSIPTIEEVNEVIQNLARGGHTWKK